MFKGDALFQGRAQLVETYDGQRTKLKTAESNFLDTMFVDNRKSSNKGRILVVCCEGNSGFYEIGIMATPIKAGYSALGWNHPGFAGSTVSIISVIYQLKYLRPPIILFFHNLYLLQFTKTNLCRVCHTRSKRKTR